jgi:prevent-host-death family protein
MRTMPVTRFKAHALAVLEEVSQTRESVVLTRRGKPIAEIIPFSGESAVPQPGQLASMVVREHDIVTPFGDEDWEASR